jgi:hypothetical protein
MAEDQTTNTAGAPPSDASSPSGQGAVQGSKILEYQNRDISADTQQMLNKPVEHPEDLEPQDKEFLEMLMVKIDKGEIDLYRPSTLLNMSVYEKLSEAARGKADFDALNLLGAIREIRKLWAAGERNTYQIEYLTHRIRLTKERLEEIGGDIYII